MLALVLFGITRSIAWASTIVVTAPVGWEVVSTPEARPVLGVDFDADGQLEIQFWAFPGGADVFAREGTRVLVYPERPGGGGAAAALHAGDLLGADPRPLSASWYQGFPVDDPWVPVSEGLGGPLLPFQINLAAELGGGTSTWFGANGGWLGVEFDTPAGIHYGWVEIDNSSDVYPWGGSIVRWGWESLAGTAISVGSIPEPPATLLVTAACCALFSIRARRLC